MASSTQACSFIDSLLDYELRLLASMNAKFNALRRAARLLEQLGDLTSLVPDFRGLLPISSITIDSYARMVQSCPMLNLPKPPFNPDLESVQAQLDRAYASLIKLAANNNWMRINALQDELDKYQSKLNFGGNIGASYLDCALAICRTVEATENTVTAIRQTSAADAAKIVTEFKTNFVDNTQGVVSDVAFQKIRDTKATMVAIARLRDVPSLPPPTTFRADADRRLIVAQYHY